MTRLLLALATSTALAAPAAAQDHSQHQGMSMPGMAMPDTTAPSPKKSEKKAPAKKPSPSEHSGHSPPSNDAMTDMPMPANSQSAQTARSLPGMAQSKPEATSAMPGMDASGDHRGHDMSAMPDMQQTGTGLPAGDAPAPTPPTDHYADRFFSSEEMAQVRMRSMREQGGRTFYQLMFNLAEYQVRNEHDGYRWDGEAFVGGDINRLWLKSEGEGILRQGVEAAEVQALYSRAIGPYFNLQAGVRQDFGPSDRTYATIGFEGLAPYMFEVEGALFLSVQGQVRGRVEGYYDQRLTQRLVLQPRVEFNFSASDIPTDRVGPGLNDAELGLRLRYEIRRQFAPYIGVSWKWLGSRTADYAIADGRDTTERAIVFGVKTWF